MEQHERIRLLHRGITPLRAVRNRKGFWQVCAQTDKGGWSVISNIVFGHRDDCNRAIIIMAELEPAKYIQDH
jgi:hypothetical protein